MIESKQVSKIELIVTKNWDFPFKLDSLSGKTFLLEKSKLKAFIRDFNSITKAKAKFRSCAVIKIFLKNGSAKLFYGEGKHFHEIIKDSIVGEYSLTCERNIIEKYWGIKRDSLCTD